MKVRLHGDSLRLRLTQPEVARLAAGGAVETETAFRPGAALTVRAVPSDRPTLAVTFEGGVVTVAVPRAEVERWAASDAEAVAETQDAGAGRTLAVSVEKDYACLHREGTEPGVFPHPAQRDARRS